MRGRHTHACAGRAKPAAFAFGHRIRARVHVHQRWMPRRVLPGIEMVEIDPITLGADIRCSCCGACPCTSAFRMAGDAVKRLCHRPGRVDQRVPEPRLRRRGLPDQPALRQVGNGGSSLRSRRFMAADGDSRISERYPEDWVLCRTPHSRLETEHGIRVAPPALARRFAFDSEASSGPCLAPLRLPPAARAARRRTGEVAGGDARRVLPQPWRAPAGARHAGDRHRVAATPPRR